MDRIIESEADRARFVAGLVLWQPGEFAYEIKQGAWYVLEPDAGTAMRKPEGLWEERIRRERQEVREKVLPLHPLKKTARSLFQVQRKRSAL